LNTRILKLLSVFVMATVASPVLAEGELNIYSARKEALIKPLLDKFAAQYDIKINLVTGKADTLIARLQNEGQFSPADVLLTTDVGRLHRAKVLGLTQTIDLASFPKSSFHDPEQHWVALTKRARPIMVAADRVDPSNITSYEDLTKPEYKGRICVRSSANIYNQSMVAALIAQKGEAYAEAWAKGLVQNFARKPQGGDRDQVKAMAAGVCDIALVNTYYLAAMYDADEVQQTAAKSVTVVWPNQADRGTHVNISGIAITKHSRNADNARALVEFMLTPEAQSWYGSANHEYPIDMQITWSDRLTTFGQFKGEAIAIEQVGQLNAKAVKVMDRAGWL
jgi:iron(III) transport system substrate-binding protein